MAALAALGTNKGYLHLVLPVVLALRSYGGDAFLRSLPTHTLLFTVDRQEARSSKKASQVGTSSWPVGHAPSASSLYKKILGMPPFFARRQATSGLFLAEWLPHSTSQRAAHLPILIII